MTNQGGRRRQPADLLVNRLPLVIVLLVAVGMHVSYILAASNGHVPWCFVYIDGCTSISSTGRTPPERYVFLPATLMTALLLALYWRESLAWLRELDGRTSPLDRAMLVMGLIAAMGLAIYVIALGASGAGFRLQRRIGVALFYIFTFGSQLLLTWRLFGIQRRRAAVLEPATIRLLIGLCALFIAGALLSLALWTLWPDFRSVEDAFEWSLTLVMFLHLYFTGRAWRESGFRAA